MRLLRDGGGDLKDFDCDQEGDYGRWELIKVFYAWDTFLLGGVVLS